MKITDRTIINGRYTFTLAWARAKKYKAIPKWSYNSRNSKKILSLYINAQVRNMASKRTKYQVDHIIPLWHPDVCGLHVWENLQILSQRSKPSQNKLLSSLFRG